MPEGSTGFGRAIIKELVAKNQGQKVIDELIKLARRIESKDLSNSIILLSNRFENYVKDSRDGLISQEEQEVNLARLNQSILDLIDDIPEESFLLSGNAPAAKALVQTTANQPDKVMMVMIYVLFAIGIVGFMGSLVFVFWGLGQDLLTNIIPFLISFMVTVTAGFFYLLTTRK